MSRQLTAAPDEGDRRNEILRNLTEIYVSRGQGVSENMRGGVELAPTAFLNSELERLGAKWRVAAGGGANVAFFDIS